MNEITGYYETAIHPGQINIYYTAFKPSPKNHSGPWDPDSDIKSTTKVPVQFKDNSHHGVISKNALRKITRAVNYLCYLVPKRRQFTTADARSGSYFLNFITLTLSSKQIHSDNEIKRTILEPFLNECRKRWHVTNYIWRAERQENGNVHFHIISDRFIWWNDLRNSWNYFQERLGYVSRYRLAMREFHSQGFRLREDLQDRWPVSKQINAWREGIRTDWNSPNSTDVHSLKTISNVRSYLAKYITKADGLDVIEGRLWGCSYDLTGLTGAREFADGHISEDIKTLLRSQQVKTYKTDFYTVIYFSPGVLSSLHCLIILSCLKTYLKTRFPLYHPPDLWDP
jgi:hypothetical protein